MSTPSIQDEKRAEHVVREWTRAHEFNVRLYNARQTQNNSDAMDNSHNELEAARAELARIRRARNPEMAEALDRMAVFS